MKLPERVRTRARRIYLELNRRTGGAPKILQRTIARYGETNTAEAAAGLAYYLFFSLFPLLLVLVTAATYVWDLNSGQAFQRAVNFISQAIPISRGVISDNLQAVLKQRGTIGIVSLIGTIWSASSAFAVLTRNVNQAWSQTKERGFLKQRLTALAIVGVLVLLLFLSLAASAVGGLLPRLDLLNPRLEFLKSVLWSLVLTQLIPFLLSMLLFLALYRWVPAGETNTSEAAAGLAYYLFFSLFPLLLVLVTAATYVWDLNSSQAFQQAVNFISQAIPISRSVISDNLQAVLKQTRDHRHRQSHRHDLERIQRFCGAHAEREPGLVADKGTRISQTAAHRPGDGRGARAAALSLIGSQCHRGTPAPTRPLQSQA